MSRADGIKGRRAQVVRWQANDLAERIRTTRVPQAYGELARGMLIDAQRYVGMGEHGLCWPATAQKLLAWGHGWLDAGVDESNSPRLSKAMHMERLEADPRWVVLKDAGGGKPLPLPSGPGPEWEDECERELVA